MVLDWRKDEEERQRYEHEYALDRAGELEHYQKAIEVLITLGHLKKEKWEEALRLVKGK